MKLFDDLCAFSAPNVFNPWRHTDPLDARPELATGYRLANLLFHFDCSPRFLMIGEAPGYQGCHFSGVPFTNEALLLKGAVPRVKCPGRITTRPRPWCEPSATIVWNELHRNGIADCTVMWNAFAWHPHKPGEPYSNRAPTRAELAAGADVLRAVLNHFAGVPVVAVGRVAAAALDLLAVKVRATVRHPSMGGATQFREQIAAIAEPTW